jgi:hypothetical protein
MKVGKVDYFDGLKRKLHFFVTGPVEEEGFYKVESEEKIFYVFVTNLAEEPLDSELRARFSPNEYAFDQEERYLLYANASILLEYRKADGKKIVGYKTIPRHNAELHTLETEDFDILGLPKLDFAHVRSGSQHFETKAGFKRESYITHWLLCGWTNSGKTNAAKVLLNVTIKGDNEPFAGGVVIDPHGEYYRDLKHFNALGNPRVHHFTLGASGDPHEEELRVSLHNVYPSYLSEVYDFREDTQMNFMHQARNAKKGDWIPWILDHTVEEIVAELGGGDAGRAEISPLVVAAVRNRLRGIFEEDTEVWEREPNRLISKITEGVTKGNWYVIDVSSIGDKTTKVVTSMIAKSLFSKYKKTCVKNREEWRKYKPAGVLVEEAHNYLSTDEAGKGNIVAKIAKEGRKFGVFTIIVEQDPSAIDQRILKQIHNKVVLQLIPKDARAICETTPYVGELENKIPYYSTGEGIFVSTGSFNFALPVKFPSVEEWISAHSTKCGRCGKQTVVDPCANCSMIQRADDAKAFM